MWHSTNIYIYICQTECKSDWVVYLGTCLKCKGQYVGKSKTVMKVRHSNHKQEIKNVVGGLGHHYGGAGVCGYNNLTLTIIEQVEEKNMEFLAERELYWQHQLRVYLENGYRNHCRKKEFGKKWTQLSQSLFWRSMKSYVYFFLVVKFMLSLYDSCCKSCLKMDCESAQN